MRDRAAGELEGRVRGVIGSGLVLLAVLVPAERDVRRAEAAHRLHLAEEVVEHVAPVAQHVQDNSAAVLLAVIPRRTLRWNAVAFEYPVAELAADREDLSEEALLAQFLQLEQARQPELVLHHAVLHARLLRRRIELLGLGEGRGHGLLAVDVLACGDRALQQFWSQLSRGRIEEDFVFAAESLI